MNSLNLKDYTRIRVLEVITVGLGVELEKDSTLAYFPTKIRWCPVEIDKHVAQEDLQQFTAEDVIEVLTYTPSAIVAGVYETVKEAATEKKHFELGVAA